MKKKFTKRQLKFASRAINELPLSERIILKMYFKHCYKLKEVAFICDLPLSLVTKIYHQAIHRLRLNYLIEFSLPQINRGIM